MHHSNLTRRRLVAASALAGATLAGHSTAFAQDATPPADAIPAGPQEHVADLTANDDVTWPAPVATTFFVDRGVGRIASFDETANKSCRDFGQVVISGILRTGNGTVSFSVKDYACLGELSYLTDLPVVQVTPQGASPALVTATSEIDEDNGDVRITVYSWDLNGQPLSDIWFYWTCIVPWGENVS